MINLTIIVPTFNAQKVVQPLLEQFACLKNVEFIFVDDGSTDRTIDVLKKFKQCSNCDVHILSFEHNGVSNSRNMGIKEAKGKYIAFIDADDLIKIDILKEIIANIERYETDIIFFQNDLNSERLNSKEIIKKFVLKEPISSTEGFIKTTPWSKFFKTDFLKISNIEFPTDVQFGEDLIFVLNSLLKTDVIQMDSNGFYLYKNNPSSVSKKIKFDIVANAIQFYEELQKALGKNSLILKQCVSRMLIKDVERAVFSNKKNAYIKKLIKSSLLFGYSFKDLNIKQKIILKLIIKQRIFTTKLIMKLRKRLEKRRILQYEEI
ncbi:epsJ [Pediococcus acidilactici]|uniref:glycosyltransferase family 2 protein n=1 Tax=Pediococcus acidilactici TaxID=1254 RepID=UPI00195287BA|nr:glycosyltransferase family 2 protein [Pediococcus acidilactici]MBM6585535.1 glycosyltransferase family 2 protein [Pediococcus acidilactici]QZQ47091.1 epsJ [Pediococcus acidilactici]